MQNLRRKPTLNELINYLKIEQPKIRYPDRTATFLRNSHYMSQFDGNLFDVEEQQKEITKEQIRETEIRNVVAQTQGTASLLRSDAAQEQNRRTTRRATRRSVSAGSTIGREPQSRSEETQTGDTEIFDMAADDKADEAMEQADAVMETTRGTEERKIRKY